MIFRKGLEIDSSFLKKYRSVGFAHEIQLFGEERAQEYLTRPAKDAGCWGLSSL